MSSKKGKLLTLDDDLPFGKYRGQQIEDVIEDDPDYVRWLDDATSLMFDDTVMATLDKRERRR